MVESHVCKLLVELLHFARAHVIYNDDRYGTDSTPSQSDGPK